VPMLSAISAERKRDELFRMLNGSQAAACMRALEMLGVFPHFLPELVELKGIEQPEPHMHDVWEHTLRVMVVLGEILDVLLQGKVRESDGLMVSFLTLGLGRYREPLAAYFDARLNPDRTLRALLQFAALYHDVGKPGTWSRADDGRIHFIGHERQGALLAAKRGQELKLSGAEVKWIEAVISNHLRFFFLASRLETAGQAPTRRAVYRFFRDAGPAGVALVLLGLADLRGTRDHLLSQQAWSTWIGVARTLLENLWEGLRSPVEAVASIDGNDLQTELGLEPGPILGQLLEAVREAQATGEVVDRAGAIAFARQWIGQSGHGSTT
jgi:UTP:GlnB (protein PII) uridylyltransferase